MFSLVSLRDTFLALMEWSVSPPSLLPYMVICSSRAGVSGPRLFMIHLYTIHVVVFSHVAGRGKKGGRLKVGPLSVVEPRVNIFF